MKIKRIIYVMAGALLLAFALGQSLHAQITNKDRQEWPLEWKTGFSDFELKLYGIKGHRKKQQVNRDKSVSTLFVIPRPDSDQKTHMVSTNYDDGTLRVETIKPDDTRIDAIHHSHGHGIIRTTFPDGSEEIKVVHIDGVYTIVQTDSKGNKTFEKTSPWMDYDGNRMLLEAGDCEPPHLDPNLRGNQPGIPELDGTGKKYYLDPDRYPNWAHALDTRFPKPVQKIREGKIEKDKDKDKTGKRVKKTDQKVCLHFQNYPDVRFPTTPSASSSAVCEVTPPHTQTVNRFTSDVSNILAGLLAL